MQLQTKYNQAIQVVYTLYFNVYIDERVHMGNNHLASNSLDTYFYRPKRIDYSKWAY